MKNQDHRFIVEFTEAEGKQLVYLLDSAVKALGLSCVEQAAVIHRKLQTAYENSKTQKNNNAMKRYIAILNSNGESLDVEVLENSIGPIVWNNAGVGTLIGAFPKDKTVAFIGSGSGGEQATLTSIELPHNSDDYVVVKAHDVTSEGGTVPALGLLVRTGIEIRVYEV